MLDVLKLLLVAGDGGDGRISFRREKYVAKGGPDGGHGGDGGSVYLEGDRHLSTLAPLFGKPTLAAEPGQAGGPRKRHGRNGDDLVIKVPLGTRVLLCADTSLSRQRWMRYGIDYAVPRSSIRRRTFEVEKEGERVPRPELQPLDWVGEELEEQHGPFDLQQFFDSKTHELLKDKEQFVTLVKIEQEGQRVLLCQGGVGGLGNDAFKSSRRVTPLIAEFGTAGEEKAVLLELALLADVGLVGFPNAGKSTLLNRTTQARSKTGAYPFTTIEPHLGVVSVDATHELVMADIPGIIAGASQGKGLGLQFLKHIESSKCLLYVLFLEEEALFDTAHTPAQLAEIVWQQYRDLRAELEAYDPALLEKPSLVSVNKNDLYAEAVRTAIARRFEQGGVEVIFFSGATGQSLSPLTEALRTLVLTN